MYAGARYSYVLSVLDVFSRYTWLRPLPDKKSSTVKTRFCKILKLYGYPRVVQHDCGSEFRKSFQKWLKNKFVIVITSRPYHPQSQGKVERMNQILKRQLAFDLIKHNREGVNWVRHLPSYRNEINDRPKECLKWQTPFHVDFGRRRNSNARPNFSPDCPEDTVDRRLIMCSAVRKAAKEATRHCDMRRNKVMMKNLKTPLYHVGERVLVRYKLPKHKVQRKTWAVTGIVVDCRHEGHRYKISFTPPNANALLGKWFHVSDLASTPAVKPRDKHSHRSKYYLPMTTENMQQNLESEFGLPVSYNPPGDGSCQFSAMAHHLANMGKQGNAATLRQEVIGYLDSQVALGNNEQGIPWHRFLAESRGHYLHRMSLDREFGDHLTLQAISELYNIQIIVVSTLNHGTTLIRPDGSSSVSDSLCSVVLGHFHEGNGDHYVCLDANRDDIQDIVATSDQISWSSSSDIESDSPNVVDSGVEHSAFAALDNVQDDMIEYDSNIDEIVNDVPVFPNEIFSYIINLTLQSDVTMLRTINRVSKMFKELATTAMYDRCLHISDNLAEALGLVYVENTVSVRKLMRYARPGSGLAHRLRDILAGNTQWYNAWLTLSAGSFGWFRITDIYWRRRR